MEWLDPWSPIEEAEKSLIDGFAQQLARETRSGHEMHGLPVKLIGRGNGDDALYEILDGTGRVAQVHLVWQGRQNPPWPLSTIYSNLEQWRVESMIPEHKEGWANEE